MAIENVAKFEELLHTNETIKAKMEGRYAAWAGDESLEKAAFEAAVAPVAAEAGLPFTYEEFQENLDGRSVDDAELEAVAGGGSCWLLGHSDGPELGCEHDSGIACAYLGIGV